MFQKFLWTVEDWLNSFIVPIIVSAISILLIIAGFLIFNANSSNAQHQNNTIIEDNNWKTVE